MHEHDMDLIMALAEGSLTESDAAAARRRLSACDQCLEDLALHEAALEALHSAPRAYLSATESAALRSAVGSSLGLQKADAPASKRARRLPFGALAGAAAVLLAVVVAGPALDLLGSSTDDRASDPVALAPAAPEIEDIEGAELSAPAAAEPDVAAGESDELSAALPPALVPAPAQQALPRFTSSLDLNELKAAIVSEGADAAAATFAAELVAPAADPASPSGDVASPAEATDGQGPIETAGAARPCDPETLGGAPGSEAVILGLVETESDGDGLVIAFLTDPIEDTVVVIVDAVTCELLQTS